MSEKIRIIKNNISLDWVKIVSGLLMIIVGVLSYNKRKEKKKYITAAGITTGILGVGLITTELESNFKPIEVDDDIDE